MKGLIYGGLSALLLTTATGGMAAFAPQVQAQTDASSMVFSFNAPTITNSGVRGSNHFVRVAVIGMSLQDLMISIPSQMERFDGVRVTDQSGRVVAAKTDIGKDKLAIAFTQPVAPGGYLDVEFRGVQMRQPGAESLLYGVTAQRVGLKGQIPIGTARIQLPGRS